MEEEDGGERGGDGGLEFGDLSGSVCVSLVCERLICRVVVIQKRIDR